jgi:phosphohistidine swiveling domain-containing protein
MLADEIQTLDIGAAVKGLMEQDRKGAFFRLSQIAPLYFAMVEHLKQDPGLNPNASPLVSQADEKLCYGQALVQLIALAQLRGIDYREAVYLGLQHCQEKNRPAQSAAAQGTMLNPREVFGPVYRVDSHHWLQDLFKLREKQILVVPCDSTDISLVKDHLAAIVSDHGDLGGSAAIVARMQGIPCLLGTRNATAKLQNGDYVSVSPYGPPEEERGAVTIVERSR